MRFDTFINFLLLYSVYDTIVSPCYCSLYSAIFLLSPTSIKNVVSGVGDNKCKETKRKINDVASILGRDERKGPSSGQQLLQVKTWSLWVDAPWAQKGPFESSLLKTQYCPLCIARLRPSAAIFLMLKNLKVSVGI